MNKNTNDNLNIALCCIAKDEDEYLSEWIEYYFDIGFSHIYIYDNNDTDSINDIIAKYQNITIINVRNKTNKDFPLGMQQTCYMDCYKEYGKLHDWIAFFDIDEFLYIENGDNISTFLKKFPKDATIIHIYWKVYGDNDILKNNGISCIDRFVLPLEHDVCWTKDIIENSQLKSILKCNTPIANTPRVHSFEVLSGVCYDAEYNKCNSKDGHHFPYTHKNAYLKHFRTKSIDEFLKKRMNGQLACSNTIENIKVLLDKFFTYNKWTLEKEQIIKSYGLKYKTI